MIRNAQAFCEDPEKCPTSIALLAVAQVEGAGMCTAFLVGHQQVMTNSHCVPEEILKNPSYASERMRVIFPASGYHPEYRSPVMRVVSASVLNHKKNGIQGKRMDYAILEIMPIPTERTIMNLSHEGVDDELKLQMIRMTPQSTTSVVGRLEERNCTAYMRSGAQPSFEHPHTSVISYSDCISHHGNSGSPLVGPKGNVRAIVHASVELNRVTYIQSRLGLPSLQQMGLATNAACITSHENPNPPARCSEKVPEIEIEAGVSIVRKKYMNLPLSPEEQNKAITPAIHHWLELQPEESPFDWDYVSYSTPRNELIFSPKPRCIRKTPSNESRIFNNLPNWKIRREVDSVLRVKAVAIEVPWRENQELNIRPREGSELKGGAMLNISDTIHGSTTLSLNACE